MGLHPSIWTKGSPFVDDLERLESVDVLVLVLVPAVAVDVAVAVAVAVVLFVELL
jgi:hypothetical protein